MEIEPSISCPEFLTDQQTAAIAEAIIKSWLEAEFPPFGIGELIPELYPDQISATD